MTFWYGWLVSAPNAFSKVLGFPRCESWSWRCASSLCKDFAPDIRNAATANFKAFLSTGGLTTLACFLMPVPSPQSWRSSSTQHFAEYCSYWYMELIWFCPNFNFSKMVPTLWKEPRTGKYESRISITPLPLLGLGFLFFCFFIIAGTHFPACLRVWARWSIKFYVDLTPETLSWTQWWSRSGYTPFFIARKNGSFIPSAVFASSPKLLSFSIIYSRVSMLGIVCFINI